MTTKPCNPTQRKSRSLPFVGPRWVHPGHRGLGQALMAMAHELQMSENQDPTFSLASNVEIDDHNRNQEIGSQSALRFIFFTESSAVRPPVLHVFLFSWFPCFSGNLFIFLGNLKFKPGHAPKTKKQRILRNVWAKNFLYRHCFICCF